MKRFLVPFLMLALTSVLSAQVMFTVTGTADSTAEGYLSGQSYTFTYITFPSYPNTESSVFSDTTNAWSEETTDDSQLWSALSGDGLTGSLVRPVSTFFAPYSYINVSDSFSVFAGSDSDEAIGLLTPEGNPIGGLYMNIIGGDLPAFVHDESYHDVMDYFSAYEGSYTPDAGFFNIYTPGVFSDPIISFTVTNATITVVPEPSTYALLGLGLASVALLRRRRA
jgi:hypothetical protein